MACSVPCARWKMAHGLPRAARLGVPAAGWDNDHEILGYANPRPSLPLPPACGYEFRGACLASGDQSSAKVSIWSRTRLIASASPSGG